jgi:hypothetical protein
MVRSAFGGFAVQFTLPLAALEISKSNANGRSHVDVVWT